MCIYLHTPIETRARYIRHCTTGELGQGKKELLLRARTSFAVAACALFICMRRLGLCAKSCPPALYAARCTKIVTGGGSPSVARAQGAWDIGLIFDWISRTVMEIGFDGFNNL